MQYPSKKFRQNSFTTFSVIRQNPDFGLRTPGSGRWSISLTVFLFIFNHLPATYRLFLWFSRLSHVAPSPSQVAQNYLEVRPSNWKETGLMLTFNDKICSRRSGASWCCSLDAILVSILAKHIVHYQHVRVAVLRHGVFVTLLQLSSTFVPVVPPPPPAATCSIMLVV